MKKITSLLIIVIILVTSCSTLVTIDSNVDGAYVYVDHKPVGTTPVEIEVSNFVGETSYIEVEAEGYHDRKQRMEKEVKVPALVGGILFGWIPLLWCYGPKDYQYIDLKEAY